MNEADTRAELIDPQLKEAGWGVVEGSRIQREYPINSGEIRAGGIRAGQIKADYILSYKNRKLAVVEAKSNDLEVGEGVGQAKLYAQKLQLETSYSTNGKGIYEICLKTGRERDVSAFPSPDDLWNKTFSDSNEWRDNFNAVPINHVGGINKQDRYYQEIAVNRVLDAIADNKSRLLLTLATGTGKTFIAFQIAWKLFKSRWNLQRDGKRMPRILFLTDRNILANQAYLAFSAFSEDALTRIKPTEINKLGRVPTNASVFFTIFQTFMSGAAGEPYFGQYQSDFFDFIIIDECHRGGASDESTWRGILDHFHPAVQLGLTATPKRTDNVDTYAYFGEPVYKYSLKEGIQDGFLTPFKVTRIQTTMDDYIYQSDDDVLEGKVEKDRVYVEKDFNRTIEIKQRERKRVQVMLASIKPNEKTLVFCAKQSHAALIRDIINQEANSRAVDYCVRVTSNDGATGDTHLRNFQDNDKEIPTILTTSRKLSTGVDARNIRNIVLMRRINSMIEFKQIIGRGTRLFEGKNYFTIIDFADAYHHFKDPEWDGEPVVEPEVCLTCNQTPCICLCQICSQRPCECPGPDIFPCPECGKTPCQCDKPEPPKMIKIKLADGKEREIQSMSSSMFSVDGKMVGVKEFLNNIFGVLQLPKLFGNEDKLRELCSNPITRRELLKRLEQEGCSKDDLLQIQEMINAEDSDLFDVLEYIGYARKPISRVERVQNAENNIYTFLDGKQREFIEFVLNNYLKDGVDELDDSKLGRLINLKYKSNTDAERVLGDLDQVRKMFIDFQKHLYIENVG